MSEADKEIMQVMMIMLAARIADDDRTDELDDEAYAVWRATSEAAIIKCAKALGYKVHNTGSMQ